MCRYHHEAFSQYRCSEPPESGGEYCIFHNPDAEKNYDKFQSKLSAQIKGFGKNPSFNFIGYVFPQGWGKWHNELIGKTFTEETTFRLARFLEGANFHSVTFEGITTFSAASFESYADFRLSESKREILFSEVTFQESGEFVEADFNEKASFSSTRFKGGGDFRRANFYGKGRFDRARFEGNLTTFEDATFEKEANFERATFASDSTEFIDTDFYTRANFSQTKFYKGLALMHSDLSKVSFRGAFLSTVDFSHANWEQYPRLVGTRSVCRDDLESEELSDYAKASDVGREIKQAYQSTGDYVKAGEFYYAEMECLQRSLSFKDNFFEKFFLQIAKIVAGYGESVTRVISTTLGVITLWAIFFWLRGFHIVNERLILSTSQSLVKQIGGGLYFSLVTFTTLGLGDVQPIYPLGHILVVAEALLGGFLMALFVVVFARKFMR